MKRMFSSLSCLILMAVLFGFAMVSTSMADAPAPSPDFEVTFMADPPGTASASIANLETDANSYATESHALTDTPHGAASDLAGYAESPSGQEVTPWRFGKRMADILTDENDRLFRMRV